MSKYNELAELAAKYSRTIFENRRQCQNAATLLMRSYAGYLGCPLQNVDFLRLDGELRTTESKVNFGMPVPMVLDGNGFWHFCGRILFEGPDPGAHAHELFKWGIRYHEGLLTIREDQDFEVNPSDPTTFISFFEHLYNASVTGFKNPLKKQSKRIGFTQ